jgi:5-(carboxyamino)imidazole ribonucleotide mutase
MPAGVPVATVSIGGAKNAGLIAVKILATSDAALTQKLADYAASLAEMVEQKNRDLKSKL